MSVTRRDVGVYRASCPSGWAAPDRTGLHAVMAAIGDDDGHAQRHHSCGRRVDLAMVYPAHEDPARLTLFGSST